MKILHISNVANLSGWSKQAENHLLALDTAGVDVYARHVNILNNVNNDLNPRMQELLHKECKNPDIIILNTLPSMYERTASAKCVGYYVVETSNFINSGWQHKINLMNAGLVPCYHNKEASIRSGVKVPLHIVPEAVDINKYYKQYSIHPLSEQLKDKFIFLCVAEWTQRKNINAIIQAFHMEFAPSEPVELVIKTTPVGMSNPQQEINSRLETIKRSLKIYSNLDRYKRENILCGFLSEQDMGSLYKMANCYVNASRAEAFSIPTMDALGFGVPVVSPNHSGMDYLTDKNAFIVQSMESPCFGALDTLPDLYSSAEHWNEPYLTSLMQNMRHVYTKRSVALKKVQAGRETVKKYSLEAVGKIYRETLEKLI